jgi:HlyD family secretion protein
MKAMGSDSAEGLPAPDPGAPGRWTELGRRWWLHAVVAATLAIAAFAVFAIILPGYRSPTTSTYGTKLGYPALLRHLGRPLPIETTQAEEHLIAKTILAEGTVASDPVQIPMVPVGRVIGVYVQPGQRVHKGDLLAELDDRRGRVNADSLRLGFEIAKAGLRRVQVGSPTQLSREQPERDAADVSSLQKQVGLLRDEVAMKEKLYGQNLLPMDRYLESKRTLEEAELALNNASVNLTISTAGKTASEQMAADTMHRAALQWQDALEELEEFKIVAPADGIVDRVFVHPGEFNQTPGTPAFVLAVGLWFEAYFDQTVLDDVVKDAAAEVHLAARPDKPLRGRVANVDPIVSYTTGGPETGRPVRPIGTGGPEWPATFQVRIELDPAAAASLAPGLTGFARLVVEHKAVAVPAAAMISVASGNGILSVVDHDGWHLRSARYGTVTDGWVEILDGVAVGEKVIVTGQDVLRPGDNVRESAWKRADRGS